MKTEARVASRERHTLRTYAVSLIDQDVSSVEDDVHALLIGKALQGRSKF